MKNIIVLFVSLIALIQPLPAFAWSECGHAIITLLAYDMLEPEERDKIVEILKHHPRFVDDFTPPDGLPNDEENLRWRIGRIGYWPDVARRQPKYHRSTWHYELGPSLVIGNVSKLIVPERPGPLPVGATLETQELYIAQATELCKQVMADDSSTMEDKAIAMCWIAHLVADAHQPCHAGSLYMEGVFTEEDGDRGANRIPTRQRKNMHALWDQLLGNDYDLADVRRRMFEIKSDLVVMRMAEDLASWDNGMDPQHWLDESREIANLSVYTPDVLDPLERVRRGLVDRPETIELPEDYLRRAGQLARSRAAQASVRLAKALSDALR
jgi:hypothetical protein